VAKQDYSQFSPQQFGYYVPPNIAFHGASKIIGYGEDSSLKDFISIGLVIWILYLLWSPSKRAR
jgi:hypothetical protein